MSELTTVARPYAKAAFDFALEQGALDKWDEMLSFAASVAQDDIIASFLSSSATVGKTTEVFLGVCGDEIDENVKNFLKVMAENERLPHFRRLVSFIRRFVQNMTKKLLSMSNQPLVCSKRSKQS